MQTLTIGRSTYKLSPSRNVGELQAKLSKFTGKTKKTVIAKERRSYPVFKAGQSTAEYINAFYAINDLGPLKIFGQLNSEPCTLYSGADLHEIMTDADCTPETATFAQEAAPVDPAPAVNVPAPVELAAPVAAVFPSTVGEVFQNMRERTPYQAPPGTLSDEFVYARWTGFPIGGYYALLRDGETLKDTPDGTMPRRFKTAAAADTYARKHHRRMARIARRTPTVSPLPRVLYSEFIRSARNERAPMMA